MSRRGQTSCVYYATKNVGSIIRRPLSRAIICRSSLLALVKTTLALADKFIIFRFNEYTVICIKVVFSTNGF